MHIADEIRFGRKTGKAPVAPLYFLFPSEASERSGLVLNRSIPGEGGGQCDSFGLFIGRSKS
jgi:hypothetical protein